MTEVLAIIPARGGSKGIPGKNIRSFAGHPLISYSIAAGLQARSVTRLIVSTDSEEIAEAARQCGAEIPFLRPVEYAQDQTTDLPVFEHALSWLSENEGYYPEILVQLRPTSPIRPPGCVDSAVELLINHPQADSVRGVVPSGQNPFKMWRIDEQGVMQPLLKLDGITEPYNSPRQILPETFWQTGHIDAIRASVILQKKSMSGDTILPLRIDPRYTVDIDNLTDWARAERLLTNIELPVVLPGRKPRPLPQNVRLVVFDFDGVFTDNRVWVDEDGHEMVAANRGDGMGIALLKNAGVEAIVLSTETNRVVAARCAKLGLPVKQSLSDKGAVLRALLEEKSIDPSGVVYLGNDVNDTGCFPLVGCAVVVADAHHEARRQADLVLSQPGGFGAVRELCDMILASRLEQR